MMNYVIGRDAVTSQLAVTAGGQTRRIGMPGSVPMTVSRQHCLLTVDDYGNMRLKNLKAQNVTYVNGRMIESMTVNIGDNITLGADGYPLNLSLVLGANGTAPKPVKTVDIRPLENIWNQYHKAQQDMQTKKGQVNAVLSGTGLISMAAIVLSFMGVGMEIRILCYILAAVFITAGIIYRYNSAKNDPIQQDKYKKWLQNNYVCPNCGRSFSWDYHTLSQYDACPFCKAKFKK